MPGARIAGVIPLALIVIGLAAIGGAVGVLRSFGPGYRVGRLLATTPTVTVAEAIAVIGDRERYIRITGRIDAADEFEDDAHRPLVLRRARLAIRERGSWRTVDEHRQAVPFEIQEGLDAIGIDGDVLDTGLVVMPRESIGTAAEALDRLPAGTPPTTPVRLRVEQVSSIEHAVVLGVPTRGPDGRPRLTAGLGRPLVLSTLEPDEAMRVLAGSDRRRPMVVAFGLAGGLVCITAGIAWAIADAVL
jgi:hypothetical protein